MIGGLLILVPRFRWLPVKLQATVVLSGTSPSHPQNFPLQMEAVFLWSLSQPLKLSFGRGINMIFVKSWPKCILMAWLRIMWWIINILSLASILSRGWKLQDSNCCLEVFSNILQMMIQLFSENCQWLQNDFDVDPDSAEGTLHPGLLSGRNKCEKLRLSIKCQCNR